MHINISRACESESSLDRKACCFYQPEHLLSFFLTSAEAPKLNEGERESEKAKKEEKELRERIQTEISAYFDTAVVASHILNTVDAVLVALSTNAMEIIQPLHVLVMELMEQLEATIQNDNKGDNGTKDPNESAENRDEPLSTWPLYCVLQFLIEQGGFLTSAFPQIHHAYDLLSQTNPSIRHHRRFLERTIREFRVQEEDPRLGEGFDGTYPQKGFFMDIQRRLNEFTTSTLEKMEMAGGDKGDWKSRVKRGRLGVQAVPARLPWTMQRTKFTH
ncbi:unnamed protein product [Phytomonas sp. Hart1]|nr:unnamed protein product [Phytomonas sp. Hart1]|eukprot:CCW69833.1 unnamed protein product [Phytomonas sp. isolate Hart1]